MPAVADTALLTAFDSHPFIRTGNPTPALIEAQMPATRRQDRYSQRFAYQQNHPPPRWPTPTEQPPASSYISDAQNRPQGGRCHSLYLGPVLDGPAGRQKRETLRAIGDLRVVQAADHQDLAVVHRDVGRHLPLD